MSSDIICGICSCCLLIILKISAQPIDQAYVDKLLDETVNISATVSSKHAEKILTRMEKNLDFYEKNEWSLDLRAAYQLFMTRLNLAIALNSTQMLIYDKAKDTPIKRERLENIRLRSKHLGSFIRYRILARVPRKNMTRQVSALIVFTPAPWLMFLPPLLSEEERYNWTQYVNRTVERKLNQSEIQPFPSQSSYVKDLTLDSWNAKYAHNITIDCMRSITMNPINESLWGNQTERNETIEMTRCRMPREYRAQCREYVGQGRQFPNDPWGHASFYRIALLTAARLARHCYFVSPETDLKILHYLCFLASIQIDKLSSINPVRYDSQYYKKKDSLTKHDFANLCLLNGLPQFIRKDLIECENSGLVWNEVGCYGPAGAGKAADVKSPLPYWIIMRPNMHENKVCNRRQTATCIAYHASVLRALVELGDVKLPPTPHPLKPGETTEWFPD